MEKKQCPLLRPAISPLRAEVPVGIDLVLDDDVEDHDNGDLLRVFDGDPKGGDMTLEIAGVCIETYNAVTAGCARKYCGTPDYAGNCPVYPESCKNAVEKREFNFSLNMPFDPEEVAKRIGVSDGRFKPESVENDFPRRVSIKTNHGKTIEATLIHVDYDGGEYSPATFYFAEEVRGDDRHPVSGMYLRDDEIETITFLE